MRRDIAEAISASGGVIGRRAAPGWSRALDGYAARRVLVPILEGVYCLPELKDDFRCRVLAVQVADPAATFLGSTAAALTWWPELQPRSVWAATTLSKPRGGYRWCARPPQSWVTFSRGLAVSHPALTVLDMIPEFGGLVIDEALRRRATGLPELWAALEATPGRVGNPLRRALLRDSRDSPWSEAERDAHRALRTARVRGWVTNYKVRTARQYAFIDIAFPELRLGFEIDGFSFHSSKADFERDRSRDALLAAAGWQIVHLSASLTTSAEQFATTVQEVLEATRRRLGKPAIRRSRVIQGAEPEKRGTTATWVHSGG